MHMTFHVPGTPVPQGSMRVYGGRVVPSNQKDLTVWRSTVAWHARQAWPRLWPVDMPVHVTATFTFPRPKSHTYKNGNLKPDAPLSMTSTPDLDKLARAVGDSLTEAAVVKDDSRIVRWTLRKEYGTTPGAHITVERAE